MDQILGNRGVFLEAGDKIWIFHGRFISPLCFFIVAPSADPPQKKKLLVPNLDLSNDWQKPRQQWEEVPAAPKAEEQGFPRKTVAPSKALIQ